MEDPQCPHLSRVSSGSLLGRTCPHPRPQQSGGRADCCVQPQGVSRDPALAVSTSFYCVRGHGLLSEPSCAGHGGLRDPKASGSSLPRRNQSRGAWKLGLACRLLSLLEPQVPLADRPEVWDLFPFETQTCRHCCQRLRPGEPDTHTWVKLGVHGSLEVAGSQALKADEAP